ncbi:MAG: hypothetical protein JO369_07670 [Paucibacter sp.]|nr:hypothetical protein [Roseateles sp.]
MGICTTSIVEWLNRVPAVVWSGCIGALIAAGVSAFGVWSANRSSLTRLRAQHDYDREQSKLQREHDSKQKEEDRKAAIRREVYIAAVEEAHAIIAYMGAMVDRPLLAGDESEALQVFLKANAKVWLVADIEGARLSRELTNLVSELYFEALAAARPVREFMEFVRRLAERTQFHKAGLKQLDVDIADATEQGADGDKVNALVDRWNAKQEKVSELENKHAEMLRYTFPMRMTAYQAVSAKRSAVQTTLVRLVSALRAELHLAPNEAEFLAIHEDMLQRATAVLNRVLGEGPGAGPAR